MEDSSLTDKQQHIVTVAAFTASGELEELKNALNEGMDVGLTVNEIREVLIQMYAYAGFPRSLNGIHTFMAVLDERKAKGIQDEMGSEPSPLPPDTDKDTYGAKVRAELAGQKEISPPSGYQLFAPGIDIFLKEHLFADIFARDVLDYRSRELATVAALASMPGTDGQLRFHLGASMNVGLTESQLKGFIEVLEAKVSRKQAEKARKVLTAVLVDRK